MKIINKLDIDPIDVFDDCVGDISNGALKAKFNIQRANINTCYGEYRSLANSKELYLLGACRRGNPQQIILDNLTKNEFVELYKKQMLPDNKKARRIYNNLLLLAPNARCPYCGFGHVSTLDHVFAKAYYPTFSVLPDNLVASCGDCNKKKKDGIFTVENIISHPYFEDLRIEDDVWLYANVLIELPKIRFEYYVVPPDNWDFNLRKRVENYFTALNLADRFSIEAGKRIVSIQQYIKKLPVIEKVREHLQLSAETEMGIKKNSWEAALFRCLSESEIFLEHYKNLDANAV